MKRQIKGGHGILGMVKEKAYCRYEGECRQRHQGERVHSGLDQKTEVDHVRRSKREEDRGGNLEQEAKRAGLAKMAGLYKEEQLGKGQPSLG